MTMHKILVAHDFSDVASRALRFAAHLARQTGAKLEVAYVHPELYDGRADPSLVLLPELPDREERYLRFLQQELETIASKVTESAPGTVPCHIMRGDPVKRIVALAQELDADALCVGATGKGAAQRVFLGSVSQLLLRSSPIPVLLVP